MNEAAAEKQLQFIQTTLDEEKRLPYARESRDIFEPVLDSR